MHVCVCALAISCGESPSFVCFCCVEYGAFPSTASTALLMITFDLPCAPCVTTGARTPKCPITVCNSDFVLLSFLLFVVSLRVRVQRIIVVGGSAVYDTLTAGRGDAEWLSAGVVAPSPLPLFSLLFLHARNLCAVPLMKPVSEDSLNDSPVYSSMRCTKRGGVL
jgi:hypothetical protein